MNVLRGMRGPEGRGRPGPGMSGKSWEGSFSPEEGTPGSGGPRNLPNPSLWPQGGFGVGVGVKGP